MSSSAAVCVLVAKAFDAVYELGLFPHELMGLTPDELAAKGDYLPEVLGEGPAGEPW